MLPKTRNFRLRLRQSDTISSRSRKTLHKGERVFANLKEGERRVLSGKRRVWGRRVYVVATRLEDGELLILAMNQHPEIKPMSIGLRFWGCDRTSTSPSGKQTARGKHQQAVNGRRNRHGGIVQ